jgi:hypothetical protein
LTTENADLLSKNEEFDVLGSGGAASQQYEPEHLPAEESDEANEHGQSLLRQRCQGDLHGFCLVRARALP